MRFGVVIPTLDEAGAIDEALRSVGGPGPGDGARSLGLSDSTANPEPGFTEIEIVVADGGSGDDTCKRARERGARVIELPRDPHAGRARQLAAGFAESTGDVVVFLHADTRLPPRWAEAIRAAFADPRVVGGAFRFQFDRHESHRDEGSSLSLRAIEWGARLRVALLRLPYGDQAIFVRRSALERMGGVPQAPIMEDLDLVAGMKRQGRLALLAAPATTSPRRYRARGVLRTFMRNAVALVGWRLGVDRERLSAWYQA